MRCCRLFIGLVFFIVPALSQAWWDDAWGFRKQITLNAAAVNSQAEAKDVPVLIRLHTGNFSYFNDLQANGADLRFIAGDDKTPLKYHIEKYDTINQMALLWVKVPKLASGPTNDNLWMYYGNKSAVSSQDIPGTYDTHQSLIYHFGGASSAPQDQTAYGNHATGTTAENLAEAWIGPGVRFAGSSAITIPSSPSLRIMPATGWTFSAWIKADGSQQNANIIEAADGDRSLALSIDEKNVYATLTAGGKTVQTQKAGNINSGQWHHVALVANNNRLIIFADGKEVAATDINLMEIGGTITLGASAGTKQYFRGDMDEVSISNTARSADWLKIAALGQGMDSQLLTYGADEQNQGGGDASYFGVILQSVTLDGWVVIGILAVMAAISWLVMLGKSFIIARAKKDNRRFIRQYEKLSVNDTDKLDKEETEEEQRLQESPFLMALFGKHDHFQSSPLYHIYHAGMHEVNQRLGRAAGAQASDLSLHAISAIRAKLDAALVRETQKLSNHMVLLTIAISGGPFLGLLGTVVGVMITFAAIAATGDVNVNAIAPGIAAALVATVAGLAVAIPALFGYNYLNSRIKEIVTDMQVFVDELIAAIAEHCSR